MKAAASLQENAQRAASETQKAKASVIAGAAKLEKGFARAEDELLSKTKGLPRLRLALIRQGIEANRYGKWQKLLLAALDAASLRLERARFLLVAVDAALLLLGLTLFLAAAMFQLRSL